MKLNKKTQGDGLFLQAVSLRLVLAALVHAAFGCGVNPGECQEGRALVIVVDHHWQHLLSVLGNLTVLRNSLTKTGNMSTIFLVG